MNEPVAIVTNIQRYCVHDGPGIRTTVFLKGCHLNCAWCSNPECIAPASEIGYVQSACRGCRSCLESCPTQALSCDNETNSIIIDRGLCNNCGICAKACYRNALRLYGTAMTLSEVFGEVVKDNSFFRQSGGGLTLSGGEPLFQSEFALALLQKAQEEGIHTAIESCLCVNPAVVEAALPYLNYIMFDLKLMDESLHKKYTGSTNQFILRNAEIISRSGIPVLPRMPLIPGVNDAEDNIKATAAFLCSINIPKIELMPYHRYAMGKYKSLSRPYTMENVLPPTEEEKQYAKELFERYNIQCQISI